MLLLSMSLMAQLAVHTITWQIIKYVQAAGMLFSLWFSFFLFFLEFPANICSAIKSTLLCVCVCVSHQFCQYFRIKKTGHVAVSREWAEGTLIVNNVAQINKSAAASPK